jgi:outer membrane protein
LRIRLLILCLGVSASHAWAQPDPAPLTLLGALGAAYQSNPRLLAARRELAQTDENVPQALAGWRPHVTVMGSVGGALFDDNLDTVHDPERRAPQDYELHASQNIYTGGQIHAQTRQAEAEVRASRANLRATEAQVLLAAGTAYLDVVRDRQIVALNANQVGIQRETVQASAVELAAGGVSAADLGQARARLGSAQAQLASAQAELARSSAAFEHQVGLPPGTLLDAEALAARPVVRLPDTREHAVAQAMDTNPDVQEARAALEAGRQGIDVERAALLPHVSLNALLGRLRDTEIQKLNQRDNAAQVTLDVSVPIYQGGANYSRIRQAKESAARLDDLLDEARLQAREQTAAAWDTLQAARTRITAERDAVAGGQVAVRGYTRQQRAGVRTLLDVLVAQQDLLSAQVAEISGQHDVLVAALQLAAAEGELDAAHLQLDVEVYDPTRHYDAVRDKWIGTEPPG